MVTNFTSKLYTILYPSKFWFKLCSWFFFEHWGQSCNLSRTQLLLTSHKGDAVYTYGLNESHGNLSLIPPHRPSSIDATLMSSNSLLTELFDLGRWPLKFFRLAIADGRCWPNVGFIHLTLSTFVDTRSYIFFFSRSVSGLDFQFSLVSQYHVPEFVLKQIS